jgi:hypothetical protein
LSSYCARPRTVDAIRYTGNNAADILAFMGGERVARVETTRIPGPGRGMRDGSRVATASLLLSVGTGEWLVRRTTGYCEVVADADFQRIYEPVT